MRSSKSRSRNKSNRQRSLGNIVNRVFDSSGPEGKVRGTPQQIIEKYLTLARDAQLSNDRVAEQSFLQHAEHYTRMLGEAMREMAERQAHQQGNRDEDGNHRDQPRENGQRDHGIRENGQRDNGHRDNGQRENTQRDPGQRDTNQRDSGTRDGEPRHNVQRDVQRDNAARDTDHAVAPVTERANEPPQADETADVTPVSEPAAEAESSVREPAPARRPSRRRTSAALPDAADVQKDDEDSSSALVETPEGEAKPKTGRTPRTRAPRGTGTTRSRRKTAEDSAAEAPADAESSSD